MPLPEVKKKVNLKKYPNFAKMLTFFKLRLPVLHVAATSNEILKCLVGKCIVKWRVF